MLGQEVLSTTARRSRLIDTKRAASIARTEAAGSLQGADRRSAATRTSYDAVVADWSAWKEARGRIAEGSAGRHTGGLPRALRAGRAGPTVHQGHRLRWPTTRSNVPPTRRRLPTEAIGVSQLHRQRGLSAAGPDDAMALRWRMCCARVLRPLGQHHRRDEAASPAASSNSRCPGLRRKDEIGAMAQAVEVFRAERPQDPGAER